MFKQERGKGQLVAMCCPIARGHEDSSHRDIFVVAQVLCESRRVPGSPCFQVATLAVEQFARVMLTAELLGGPHVLPRADVQKLAAARPRHDVPSQRDREEPPLRPESGGDRGTPARQELAPLLEETTRGDRPHLEGDVHVWIQRHSLCLGNQTKNEVRRL